MAFDVFETAADTRYRYSGSSTNWSSRGSVDSLPEFHDPGGDLAVADLGRPEEIGKIFAGFQQ